MTITETRGIGDNVLDHGRDVAERFARDHAELQRNVSDLLEEARALPATVENEDHQREYALVIRRLRDVKTRIEAQHGSEKQPFLRGGEAVDSFFFGLWEKVIRRSKTAKAGAIDVLQARLHDYVQRKAEAERLERQRIANEAAEKERVRIAAEAAAKKAADDAAAAALRARTPHTQEAKQDAAQAAAVVADNATVDRLMATDTADAAHLATKAKTADLVRTRIDEGAMVTSRKVAYAEIDDESLLDKAALWPYIPLAAKQQALNAWAKSKGHQEQMAGARIGQRDQTVVR